MKLQFDMSDGKIKQKKVGPAVLYTNSTGDLTGWVRYSQAGDGPNQMTDAGGYLKIECYDNTDYPQAYAYYRYTPDSVPYTWQDYSYTFTYLGRGGSAQPAGNPAWGLHYNPTGGGDIVTCAWLNTTSHFTISAYTRTLHQDTAYSLTAGDVVMTTNTGPVGNMLQNIYVNGVLKYSQTNTSLASYPPNATGTILVRVGSTTAYGDCYWMLDDIVVTAL